VSARPTRGPAARTPSVRDRLSAIDVRPSRRRGQSFLADGRVAKRIVAAADVGGRRILEIGPGLGALTDEIAASGCEALVAVEIESELAAHLRERFADRPAVRIVEGDALELEWGVVLGERAPWRVVANLPYSVATPILLRLLDERGRFDRVIVMVQREVADRIVATADTRAYGPLTIAVALRGRASRLFHVSPGAFSPRPKVESTVVAIDPGGAFLLAEPAERKVRMLVRAAFAQRRKTLRRALAGVVPGSAFEAAGIDAGRRGETLSLAEYATLADALPSGVPPTEG
jgi:16S rRNA (adenine1518-N6/adenine1519-N6)-dimethyltransferase